MGLGEMLLKEYPQVKQCASGSCTSLFCSHIAAMILRQDARSLLMVDILRHLPVVVHALHIPCK